MKQEQIHIRVSEVEKAQLLKLAGHEKLSKYLLRRALEAPIVQGQAYVDALMAKVREKQKTDVYTSEETDDEIQAVREACDICGGREFRKSRITMREECVACCKG